MSACWRLVIAAVVGSLLSLESAALICIPAGLGPNWWIATSATLGLIWALMQDRIIAKVEAAWKELRELADTQAAQDGDGPTLLALAAMRPQPVHLIDLLSLLNPCPDGPSWWHPGWRWNVMTAWVRRNDQLVAEVGRLTEAGLLRCAELARPRGMSLYEATGLGRDVAARNAEVLVALPKPMGTAEGGD